LNAHFDVHVASMFSILTPIFCSIDNYIAIDIDAMSAFANCKSTYNVMLILSAMCGQVAR